MSSAAAQEENSQQHPISIEEEKDSRDSTGSSQSGGSSSNSGDCSTKAATNPASSIPSINIAASASAPQHLDPSPAVPLANPRKQKSTGILNLLRSPSSSRQRSGSLLGIVMRPETVPPLPSKKGPKQPPKSILTPSSSSSSLSHSTATSPTLSRSPSIQFAPLPQLAPRQRKSSVPLGIAAKSAMMQRRRQIMYGASAAPTHEDPKDAGDGKPAVEGAGMWTPAEAEEHLTRQLRSKEKERERILKEQQKELEKDVIKSALKEKHSCDDEMENDDELVAFGRLVKDAWRKVGKKDAKSTGKTKVDSQIRTQAQAEVDVIATSKKPREPRSPVPASPLEAANIPEKTALKDASPGDDDGSADHESDTPTEEDDHNNDDEIDLDADIDPNEVDVSKIGPLRAGSPPPSHNQSASRFQSETSSIDESDETANSDSTMTSPSAMSPPSPTTPMANTHKHSSAEPSTLEQTPTKNRKGVSVTIDHSEELEHRLPSLEVTPLSPFLVI